MKDKELKLNASGYKDEPCYKAIKAVDAPKPGEIYIHGDTGRYVLVLNCVNGVCAILNLTEQEREDRIPIMVRVKMYTNPIMITYAFTSALAQYVKTITDDEFENVKRGIVKVLGLQDACNFMKKVEIAVDNLLMEDNKGDAQQNTINDLTKRNAELLEERDKLLEEIAGYGKTIKNQAYDLQVKEMNINMLGESLAKVEREADRAEIYKEMYMTLLEKVISARGVCE